MTNFWQKLNRPILALAPMAGITDSPFRQICKDFGADVVYTEMVSADGIAYKSKKTLELLEFDKNERPVVLQLFGKKPENFAKAINNQQSTINNFDGIDINFGCPAKKVVAHGGGVTLMRDLKLAREIVKAVCDVSELPVSIKIRTSISMDKKQDTRNNNQTNLKSQITNSKKITALDFLQYIADLPISAVMVHGRSYEQGFSGAIDFRMIREIVKIYGKKWIILANGGINTPADAKEILDKTGAHGIGLGRGVYGRPWLFKEIKEYLSTTEGGQALGRLQDESWSQIKKTALKHAELAYKSKGGRGIVEMRKHLAWYVKGRPDACELRRKLVRVESLEEIRKIL